MENRSFDHFLGWIPGADGQQAGLSYTDRYGIPHTTHHLTDFQGCAHPDPDHSYEGGRIQYNNGKNNGWLRAGKTTSSPSATTTPPTSTSSGQAGPDWTVCDRYFAATMAEIYPNRFYQHAAATDRLHNSTVTSTLPTSGTGWLPPESTAGTTTATFRSPRCGARSTSGSRITTPSSSPMPAPARLPGVSFVDPRFTDEGSGTSGDDHPHADIRSAETFLAAVYNAVTTGPR